MVEQSAAVALDYANKIVSGKKKACRYAKLACQRHINDLKKAANDPDYPYYFDEVEAQMVISFINILKHSKGSFAGKPFYLADWQIFIVSVFFGWKKKKNRFRKYRTLYIEVPRKNGKSTLLAAIGLYLLVMDGEAGAEVYSAATKKDQAMAVWEEAKRMVKACQSLRKRVKIYRSNLSFEATYSKFDPLSADADTLDGLNVSGGIVDELHAHKTSAVWDVLDSGTGSRDQPAIIAITTAGGNQHGICYQLRADLIKILEGIFEDDSIFGIIYTIDGDGTGSIDKKTGLKNDDAFDPEVWEKANPCWGESVKTEDIERLAAKAKRLPSQYNNFLTKRLNVWVNAVEAWVNVPKWLECFDDFDKEKLKGRVAYGGLDLASVSDLASFRLIFPMNDGTYKTFGRAYCPEDAIDDRSKLDGVPYQQWVDDGYLVATPGATVDYDFIKKDIMDFCEIYDIRMIGVDRWNSTQIVNDLLDDEVPIVSFGQGFASMNAPMKELERLYLDLNIEHDGDPVMNWAMSNVVAKFDEAENIKPDKKKSTEKIDPVVALIIALGVYLNDDTEEGDDPGLIDLEEFAASE